MRDLRIKKSDRVVIIEFILADGEQNGWLEKNKESLKIAKDWLKAGNLIKIKRVKKNLVSMGLSKADEKAKRHEKAIAEIHDIFFGPNEIEIAGDSCICDYCQRRVFPEYGDDRVCYECENYEAFIGVNCNAMRGE